jgi:hypothetical protein
MQTSKMLEETTQWIQHANNLDENHLNIKGYCCSVGLHSMCHVCLNANTAKRYGHAFGQLETNTLFSMFFRNSEEAEASETGAFWRQGMLDPTSSQRTCQCFFQWHAMFHVKMRWLNFVCLFDGVKFHCLTCWLDITCTAAVEIEVMQLCCPWFRPGMGCIYSAWWFPTTMFKRFGTCPKISTTIHPTPVWSQRRTQQQPARQIGRMSWVEFWCTGCYMGPEICKTIAQCSAGSDASALCKAKPASKAGLGACIVVDQKT